MRSFKISIAISALAPLLLLSCNHSILDKNPLDKYSDADMWSDINLSKAYLNDCYHSLRHGMNEMMLSAVTDETFFIHVYASNVYLQGNITADNTGTWGSNTRYQHTSWWLFNAVQKVNIFLANIDDVPKAYPEIDRENIMEQVNRIKGEAYFLRAYAYTQMCRTYGGLPIIRTPFKIRDDFLQVERATFEETVNFILEDCEEAQKRLAAKDEMELGRATQGAAMALKSRILLFAASDLTADGAAKSEYVGYIGPDRNALWTRAKEAAYELMTFPGYSYSLEDFGGDDQKVVAEEYYDFFRSENLLSNEIIWGKMFLKDVGARHRSNLWNGPNGLNCWGGNNPTQNFVDYYQMEDGTPFEDHFDLSSDRYYINKSSKYFNENPYYNREPRFYATVLYDSARWQSRFDNLAERDPLGIYERRTHRTIKGTDTIDIYGIDTRKGPIEDWNGGYTGYLMKKMLDHDIIGRDEYNDNVWIEFRYAEILLNYAEACIGLGEHDEATTYINMIRNRAGLPDFIGDITKALRYERKIEFAFEDKRWYDVRRWKILDEVLTDALGVDIIEQEEDGVITTTWRQINVQRRGPASEKLYWIPIPTEEIKKAPQLVQNPGY